MSAAGWRDPTTSMLTYDEVYGAHGGQPVVPSIAEHVENAGGVEPNSQGERNHPRPIRRPAPSADNRAFVKLDRYALADIGRELNLSFAARGVLLGLVTLADFRAWTWRGTIREVSENVGTVRRTVARALDELAAAGAIDFVVKPHSGGAMTVEVVVFDRLVVGAVRPEGGTISRQTPLHLSAGGWAGTTPFPGRRERLPEVLRRRARLVPRRRGVPGLRGTPLWPRITPSPRRSATACLPRSRRPPWPTG